MVFEVLQKGVKDFEPIVLAVEMLCKTLGTSALNVLKERNFLKVGKYICTLLIIYKRVWDQFSHHMEISQLICTANQLPGFYMA